MYAAEAALVRAVPSAVHIDKKFKFQNTKNDDLQRAKNDNEHDRTVKMVFNAKNNFNVFIGRVLGNNQFTKLELTIQNHDSLEMMM